MLEIFVHVHIIFVLKMVCSLRKFTLLSITYYLLTIFVVNVCSVVSTNICLVAKFLNYDSRRIATGNYQHSETSIIRTLLPTFLRKCIP